jgi:hypothetical protein
MLKTPIQRKNAMPTRTPAVLSIAKMSRWDAKKSVTPQCFHTRFTRDAKAP